MALMEIRAEIPRSQADHIELLLLEHTAGEWSLFEDVDSGRAWVVGLFPTEDAARVDWAELAPMIPEASKPVIRELPDTDWRESYKAHFKAWHFGILHWVPVWERETFIVPRGDSVLWLDPGMAFGTGNHETTRLCCERLVGFHAEMEARRADVAGIHVIDAGCGSGILALSAALLGFRNVAGFDNDPEAVRVSRDNAVLNGLGGAVEFFTAGLDEGLADRKADLLMANIQADVLMRHAPLLAGALAPGGRLVLSGILARELEQVRGVFAAAAPGLALDSRTMGEWSDLMLTAGQAVSSGPGH